MKKKREKQEKKEKKKQKKKGGDSKTKSASDFDTIKGASDLRPKEEYKAEEVEMSSGVNNRRSFKQQGAPIMLTPTIGAKTNFYESDSEEIDNPVMIAGGSLRM